MLTRGLIYHVASGQSFFAGAGCLVAAVLLNFLGPGRPRYLARNLLAALGVVLVAASATPLAPGLYAALTAATVLGWAAEGVAGRVPRRFVLGARAVVVAAWVAAMGVEVPYHVAPGLPRLGHPTLGIIGDSLTAGTGEGGPARWPQILADRHAVAVRDHARAGATVASALRQAAEVGPEEQLVLLEIGGNDLLGGSTPLQFEVGLDQLLSAVCRPGRVVVLMELPLPPTFNAFGRIQRRLARRYGTPLVPKRVLLGILQRPGATLDTIHLSPEGHRAMAGAIWDAVRAAHDEGRR